MRIDLDELGPRIEHDPVFPERINVNVAEIHPDGIRLRTWERGSGITRACGTGASATAVAAILTKRVQSPVKVTMRGGCADHCMGAGPADPHARRRDLRLQGRDRPGGACMSVETITLGCRLNFAESETIKRLATTDEDWVVVNSCAVTNEAVRQTRQAIRRSRRERPDARILVTGCAAELDPNSFAPHAGSRSRRRK